MASRSRPTPTFSLVQRAAALGGLLGIAGILGMAVFLIGMALAPIGGCAFQPIPGTADAAGPFRIPAGGPDPAAVGGLATLVTGNPAIGAAVTAVVGLIGAGWARSAGRHKGWSEREEAATAQAPLPAPVAVVAAGPVVGVPAAAPVSHAPVSQIGRPL